MGWIDEGDGLPELIHGCRERESERLWVSEDMAMLRSRRPARLGWSRIPSRLPITTARSGRWTAQHHVVVVLVVVGLPIFRSCASIARCRCCCCCCCYDTSPVRQYSPLLLCCCAARASLRSSLPLRWGWVGGWMGGVEQTSLSALLCSAVCPRKRSLVSLLSNYSTYKTCYRRTYFFSHTHAHKCRKRERKKETFRSIAHTTHVLIVHLLLLPLLRPTKAKVMGIWNNQDGNLAPIRLRQQPLLCTATA